MHPGWLRGSFYDLWKEVAVLKMLENIHLDSPSGVVGMGLVAWLVGLLIFTIYIERRGMFCRDWRYFKGASLRDHLWVFYLVCAVVYLAWVL